MHWYLLGLARTCYCGEGSGEPRISSERTRVQGPRPRRGR